MAFYGYLETFIHFHSLRNIDLFHQGLYQVRCHVYREYGPGDIFAAAPWRITTSPLETASEHRKARSPRDTHCLSPSYIAHSNKTFTTRTFQIRFCDEEVELNDGVTFRLEFDLSKPASYSAPIFIEFQLMYAEAPPSDQQRQKRKTEAGATQTNADKKHGRRKHRAASTSPTTADFLASPLRDDKASEKITPEQENNSYRDLNWIVAAYQVMKVHDPLAGQSAYMQATFDHLHFCVCHFTLYTAMMDIRQGLHQPGQPPVLEPRHNQRKLPPTLNATSLSKEGTNDRVADQGQNFPEQLTTPRETAPYWSTTRVSPARGLYHAGGNMTLLDHLAAVTKCFCSLSGEAMDEFAEGVNVRRLTVDFGQPSTVAPHKTLPRNTLGPGLLVPPETEVVRIILARAERVYREYLTMLTRTYYRLRAYIITISYRCLSEMENKDLNWIWMSGKQFYLPGKLTIEAKPNGLPEQSINLSDASKLGTLSFTIPAHICIDAAQEMLETNDLRIAGATRSITLPFYPLNSRLRSAPPFPNDPVDAPFIAELQGIFIEDFNLIWSQIHDSWQKLKVLVSLVHKETQYFHQMIWEKRIAARCREVAYLELNSARSASTPVDQNIGLLHNQIAEELRTSKKLQHLPPLPIEDVHGGFDPSTHPIIFEERYSEDVASRGVMGGYLEKRDRLSNIHGGLRGSIPEGITSPTKLGLYKPLELHKLKPLDMPDAGEIILTNRQRGSSVDTARQVTPDSLQPASSPKAPFEDLKALALMKQAEDETGAANTLGLPQAQSPHLLQMPAGLPDVPRHISGCTTLDSIDSSMEPADEEVSLTEEDLRFLKINCPVFEQVSLAPKIYPGSHLVVLVHGFQGNAMDMRLLRNQFSLVFPEGLYLASTSNEEQTEGDLSTMGSRLAAEVLTYMAELCPADSIGRVSFVGHSLGGLIIRAALPHLGTIAHKFHLFLTLSSPHLGYIFARNRLVDAGLWVLKKWKKSIGLQQLSMSDHRDPRGTFLYKLSQRDDLKFFSFVVFVSCFQDQYIPYESARVEISTKIKSDPQWGSVHIEMVKNMLSSISKNKLIRLDTCFKIADRSIDTLIGRTAHIQFLGSQQLAQTLVMTYPQWFS